MSDELKVAIEAAKKGAFINDKKVNVSQISEVKNSLLLFGSLRFFKDKKPLLRIANACASSRSLVSPYELHLLASGRCEIVLDAYAKMWDIAPFIPIIEDAGGKVTNWKGKPWQIGDQGYIATNNLLHNEVMGIIRNK